MALATRIASGDEGTLSDVHVALRGDTGIGKSHVIRELLADAIGTIRKAGNDRPQ
jgi:predicted GTPase